MKTKNHIMILLNAKKQSGMLLIEVMIAIVIFSFGLLGLAGLQATATQNSAAAEERIRASLLANDMVSILWARQSLSSSDLSNDIANWKGQVSDITKSGLANAEGSVDIAANIATVKIKWKTPSKKSGDNINQYFTSIAMKS